MVRMRTFRFFHYIVIYEPCIDGIVLIKMLITFLQKYLTDKNKVVFLRRNQKTKSNETSK